MREVKVFVSSPGDLRNAPDDPSQYPGEPLNKRQQIKEILHKLNDDIAYRGRYTFVPYLYEELTPAVVAGKGPQAVVDEWMLRTRHADIVVCLFWARMGTPLARVNPDTGKPYESGTEYEFYDAYWVRRNLLARRKPTILLYRYNAKPPAGTDPEQLAKVMAFFSRFEGRTASLQGMYKTFDAPKKGPDLKPQANLEDLLTADIKLWVRYKEGFFVKLLELVTDYYSWGFAGIAIILALILFVLLSPSAPPPKYPFNIAVAGFIPSPSEVMSERDVQTLTDTFYANLDAQLAALRNDPKISLKPGAWPPSRVGVVKGSTAQEREKNAIALVKQLKEKYDLQTDLVVYGVIERREGQLAVVPEFYVSATSSELNELFGRFKLQEALTAPSPDQLKYLSAELTARSEILSHVVEGLIYMILQDYDKAYQAYERSLMVSQKDPIGQELTRILMANAAISNYNRIAALGDPRLTPRLPDLLKKADDNFTEAVKLNPDYSRGFAGLGSVQYLRALEPVSARQAWQEIDEATLKQIEATFQKTLTVADRPDSADIPTKVAFGLGEVCVVRYLRGDQQAWDCAEKQFKQVIADYGKGSNIRVQEFAAQSYGFLGLLNRQRADFATAREAYQMATQLTQLDARRNLFKQSVLDVTFEENRASGKVDEAVKAYDDLFAQFPKMPAPDKATRLFHKGKMLSEAGRSQAALNTYEQAVKLDLDADKPLAATLYAVLGDKYYDMNRLEDAAKAYEKALELDPQRQGHLKKVIQEVRAEIDKRAADGRTPSVTPSSEPLPTRTD